MMLVFWGGLVAVIVLGVRAFGGGSRPGSDDARVPDATTVLENRFARGEISQDEFEQRKRVLESSLR